MNDQFNRWFTDRGFTGTINDKQKQYLLTVVAGAGANDSLQDLWMRGGQQQGWGTDIMAIQIMWALAQGATSTATWNDAMNTLPP